MQFYKVEMKGEVILLSVDYAADLFRRLATGAHIIILYSHAAFLTPTNACKVRRPDYIEANIAGQSLSSVLHSCSYTEGKVLLHDRAYSLYFYICKYT